MKKDKIVRNLLEKATAEFTATKKREEEENLLSSITARQKHFEKNYKKK